MDLLREPLDRDRRAKFFPRIAPVIADDVERGRRM